MPTVFLLRGRLNPNEKYGIINATYHGRIGVSRLNKRMQIAVLILTTAVMLIGLIAYVVLESPAVPATTSPRSNVMILRSDSSRYTEQTDRSEEISSSIVSEKENKVNINTASAEQLMEIDGIGKMLAARIIAYRKAHGDFTDLAQLRNIKVIGNQKFDEIKEYVTVS